jgi:hypothetical protein
MDIYDYLEDVDRGLAFALWLYRQQTVQERQTGTTVEANRIGFNTPDAKRLDQSLKALSKGIKFPRYDIIKWYRHDVEKRLVKYKKQFKLYMTQRDGNSKDLRTDSTDTSTPQWRHTLV